MSTDDTRARLVVGLLLTVIVAGGLSWSALHLASILTQGQPADIGLGEALLVATRAVIHPTAPIPADRVGELPGTVAFYLSLIAIVMLSLAAGLAASRHAGISFDQMRTTVQAASTRLVRRPPDRGASWAERRDLQPLIVPRPIPGRLTLGRAQGRLLATEPLHSVLVVGPSGSRKTTALAVPAMREWHGPVVSTSVKTDVLDATIDQRRQLGPVLVYDPAGITGQMTDRWTPLHGCQSWRTAQRRASTLCRVANAGRSRGDMDFWYTAAARLVALTFFAAAHADRSMSDVVRWINLREDTEVRAALELSRNEIARHNWRAHIDAEPKTRSSVYTTAQTAVAVFADHDILASTTGADITADRLLHGEANTLYLVAPVDQQEQLAPLFVSILDELAGGLYARGAAHPLDPPMLWVLDELANIAPIPQLDKLAATIRGQGGQLLTIVQDLAQLNDRYGPDAAKSIINNHHAKLILPGAADPTTLDWAARITGDEQIHQRSTTARAGNHDSTTHSTSFRPLAPAHRVREQQTGHGLLVYGNLPPVEIALRSQPQRWGRN